MTNYSHNYDPPVLDPTESTDEGHDVAEGEIAYRIEARGDKFAVIEYAADDPTDAECLDLCDSYKQAEAYVKLYVSIK